MHPNTMVAIKIRGFHVGNNQSMRTKKKKIGESEQEENSLK